MKKGTIYLFSILSCFLALNLNSNLNVKVHATNDDKDVQMFSRIDQNEGLIESKRDYTGLNIKWKSNNRLHKCTRK